MAYHSIWYFTDLPEEIVNILDKDLINNFDYQMKDSKLYGDEIDKKKRDSENAWISSTHWVAGFLWYYIQMANRKNFFYDITHIDNESLQYTKYSKGHFYNWHNDAGLTQFHSSNVTIGASESITNEEYHKDKLSENYEFVRKLSFSLQLSDPDDYEGGNVQLLDENNRSYIAPRNRGAIILFDSRTQHRVLKVTKGVRRSIVGWVVGPRWK